MVGPLAAFIFGPAEYTALPMAHLSPLELPCVLRGYSMDIMLLDRIYAVRCEPDNGTRLVMLMMWLS